MPDDLPLNNPNPTAFPASFDAAVLDGGYVSRDGCWNAHVNADIGGVWYGDDVLDRAEIVERYSARLRARFQKYRGTSADPRSWADAGNLVHHALRLGLLREETTAAGERGWRILDRDPHWIIVGTGYQRECRQVRGLPPAEQAIVDKEEATARKRNATLDRNARRKAVDRIARYVRGILDADPATLVPASWAHRGWIPTWLPGTRLDACAGIVRDAHHAAEMTRPTLKTWLSALEFEVGNAGWRALLIERERAALPAHANIPAADDAALEALL